MPAAVADLDRLGVCPEGRPIAGIRYVDEQHEAQARFRAGPGRGVRRTTLHAALSAAVAEAGVAVEPVAVGSIEERGDHLLVDGEPARYLVAADGLHSSVRRLVGLEGRPAVRRRFGLRRHFEVEPWSDFVDVHWARHRRGLRDAGGSAAGRRRPARQREARLRGGARRASPRCASGSRARRAPGCAAPGPCGSAPPGGSRAGCCWSETPRATSTRSPARASRSGSARRGPRSTPSRAGTPERYEQAWRRMGLAARPAHPRAAGRDPARRAAPPDRAAAAGVPWVFSAAVNELARAS